MLVPTTFQLAVLAAVLCSTSIEVAALRMKLCGRNLGVVMSRVCHDYNSPSWDVPTVVEQPAAVVRRRRQTGIADECCTYGCTWKQLGEYCAVSANSESPLELMESHMIEDRSAETGAGAAGKAGLLPREVGARSRGYGGSRRCRCRRRSGRRRTLMGNMDIIKSAVRAAPVVGTVSPLLTWGRTLNTDLPSVNDRYAYVIYA